MGTASRLWRNLVASDIGRRRAFPAALQQRIADTVRASELQHRGEIRFVVETACDPLAIWRGMTPRDRAVALFSQLRVWDTADNSGVLVYVLYAEHGIEIVADRGITARVPQATWDAICTRMAEAFRSGDFDGGCLRAIADITTLLAANFPAGAANPNELPDAPLML